MSDYSKCTKISSKEDRSMSYFDTLLPPPPPKRIIKEDIDLGKLYGNALIILSIASLIFTMCSIYFSWF